MMNYCRLSLERLKSEQDIERGYSQRAIKELFAGQNVSTQLPFTRDEFVRDLPAKQKGMSISGYQPKLQLVISDSLLQVLNSQGEFILKPSPNEFPKLAENEHATMCVMKRLGFEVPACGLIPFKAGNEGDTLEYAFMIKRYDRDSTGNAIHQEQLDAAMGIGEKYGKIASDGEGHISYEQLADFIIKHVNDNILFKQDLFRRIIYAYLLGNNDMHLRNFGLIHPKIGKPYLAPVYDFVSVAPYSAYFHSGYLALPLLRIEEGGKELAPSFHSQYGEYTGTDFKLLGVSMGLSETLINDILVNQLNREKKIVEETYSTSFMPLQDISAVLACYHSRLTRLQYTIET